MSSKSRLRLFTHDIPYIRHQSPGSRYPKFCLKLKASVPIDDRELANVRFSEQECTFRSVDDSALMPDRGLAGTQHFKPWTARVWKWYLASAIPLAVLYLWLPVESAKLYAWPVIGWSSVVAIIIGIRVNRPSAPMAWYLFALGVGTFILGDNLYSFRTIVQHSQTVFPSYVDVVYLAVYPLLVGGMAVLLHRRSSG